MVHNHDHHIAATKINRAFWIGICLNSIFVIIEFVSGFYFNSLALLSDAGHNLSDVASLGLSLFAFKISRAKANERFTYGYHKSTILASLANAIILLIAVGSIGWEAIQRFISPEQTNGYTVSIVATIGIIVNASTALLFFKSKDRDLNVKGAYLHMASDAIVSLGVVIAGIIIAYTDIRWIDPMISLLIMMVVIYSRWNLLMESFRLSMDAVPANLNTSRIVDVAKKFKEVMDIHHIHVWALSTSQNAMTAHIIVEENLTDKEVSELKHNLKHEFQHLNIHHVTLETETVRSEMCDDC